MGLRHDQPPPVRANPLEVTGDVAFLVLAILHRAPFIAEHERSEEHLADGVSWKKQPEITLRTVEPGQPLEAPFGPHTASEGGIGCIIEVACFLRAKLDHSAAIYPVRNCGAGLS